jgi:OOP family OmpA-OmpF porin
MRALRISGALVAVAILGGCAVASSGYDIDKLRAAQPKGDAFTAALTSEYRELMNFEADEMYDWVDASYYAKKGLRASSGETVLPQPIAERRLPAEHVQDLTNARGELVDALFAGGRDAAPAEAARAQAMFDCWMEQQEENIQPEHIARCRDGFRTAMDALKAAMAPKPMAKPAPAPAPAPAAPVRFVVFFPFDSATVTSEGMGIIQKAVQSAGGSKAVDFTVTGHADRAGAEDYNLGLSLRRAEAVQQALAGRGVAGDKISIAGRGEAENAVPTADGVREQANRRVEIILLR